MRAILLAAGRGQRLGPLTQTVPKPLLRARGEVILEHNLQWLARQDITRIVMNVSHQAAIIQRHCDDGKRWGVSLVYSHEPFPLGTAGGVRKIVQEQGHAWGPEPFVVIYADNFYPFTFDLQAMRRRHIASGAFLTIGLYWNPGEMAKSGVAQIDTGGRITSFIEKPVVQKNTCAAWINTGLYICDPQIVAHIPDGVVDFAGDVFPALLGEGKEIYGHSFSGRLTAVDTPELYQRAQQEVS